MPAKIYKAEYFAPQQTTKNWQVALVGFMALAIPFTLVAIKLYIDYRSRADANALPTEVIVSNITDTSATISFFTDGDPVKTSITYEDSTGGKGESLFDERAEGGNDKFLLHYHKLTNLKPKTEYTFEIKIGSNEFPNDDVKFDNKLKTLETSSNIPTPKPVNGKVTGDEFTDSVIYIHLTDGKANSSVISALIPESSGAYSLDLGSARKLDGSEFREATHIIAFASTGLLGRGFSSAKNDQQFLPDITLSESTPDYDPTNLDYLTGQVNATPTEDTTPSPTASPSATPTATPSKQPTATPTQISTPVPTTTPTPILFAFNLTNISSGQDVTTGSLISGKAKPNSVVEIEIPGNVTNRVTSNNRGEWQFQLPDTLPTAQTPLVFKNEGQTLNVTLSVINLEGLPDTAIQDYMPYLLAFAFIAFGVYLVHITQNNIEEIILQNNGHKHLSRRK